MRTVTEVKAERDRQAIARILHILTEQAQFAEATHRDNRQHGRYDDAALGIRTQTRLEQLEQAIRSGLFDRLDADSTTEAFVDVADAERYAQREEFVNGPGFAVSDLVNVSDPGHKHFGVRGSIVGFVYDPDGVVVEYDNLGNTTTVTAAQLMHHTEFVKQPDEFFESAEQQAAKDAEAADDAMSASERHEHDQADEFAQDAADAERWTEENAANQYDDAHYNTDDENQDDEDGEL